MIARAALLVALTPGCSIVFGLEAPQRSVDGGVIDGETDALTCYGSGIIRFCPVTAVELATTLTDNIDTSTDPMCRPESTEYCVLAAEELSVAQAPVIRVTGGRPLVLVGTRTVAVSVVIDVGSYLMSNLDKVGPGEGLAAQCAGATVAGNGVRNAGGGAGGSFGARGGTGGSGGMSGGAGGQAANARPAPTELRGGCRGSDGGIGGDMAQVAGGNGGHGGGVVYVIAGASISVAAGATLFAGGQGGRGGVVGGSGGGGGGSGGLIGLDAPSISCAGTLSANGGGGGEGGAKVSGSGQNGASALDLMARAPGGTGNPDAGDGGDGTLDPNNDGEAGMVGPNDAGGGGGGGGGVIKVYGGGSVSGCAVSPAPT